MGVAKALARLLALAAALVGTSFVPALQPMLPQLHDAASELWALVEPGGRLHPSGFIEFKGHIVVEGFLLVVISYLLFQSSAKPKQKKRLTERVRRARGAGVVGLWCGWGSGGGGWARQGLLQRLYTGARGQAS